MYKSDDKLQSSFLDFNQPMGLHMNPENRWIRMADMIPWDASGKRLQGGKKTLSQLCKIKETLSKADPQGIEETAFVCQARYRIS